MADSRQAANRLVAKLRASLDSRTVEATLDLWTEARLRSGSAAPASIAEQAARVRNMLEPIFDRRLDEVTERKAAALYERIVQQPSPTTGRRLSAATHRFYLSIVESMWRWAQKQGYAQDNPWTDVEPVGRVAAGKPQLRPAEARRFAQLAAEQAAAGSTVALAALCCLSLGLRASEALGLTVRDFDIESSELYVNGTKTAGSRRRLKISAHLGALLTRAAAGKVSTERLCTARRQTLHKAVVALCERASVPRVCVHGLRGTHASLAVSGGASVDAVARVLGHTSTKMTLSHYITEEAATEARLAAVESFLYPAQSFRGDFSHPISDEKIVSTSLAVR
jgi:integrase